MKHEAKIAAARLVMIQGKKGISIRWTHNDKEYQTDHKLEDLVRAFEWAGRSVLAHTVPHEQRAIPLERKKK